MLKTEEKLFSEPTTKLFSFHISNNNDNDNYYIIIIVIIIIIIIIVMTTFFCLEFMFGSKVSPPPPVDTTFALVFLLFKHGTSLFSSHYNIPKLCYGLLTAPNNQYRHI